MDKKKMAHNQQSLKQVSDDSTIPELVAQVIEENGGVFRLAPAWVGRPGIIVPGRRIKLLNDEFSNEVVVNERWLASTTFADNGVYNTVCPENHGLSYIASANQKYKLSDAIRLCPNELLGPGKKWDVLSKFFDNRGRIPFHLHPCGDHVSPGLHGKPESYHYPVELNMNRNNFPISAVGIDPLYSDREILSRLKKYFTGDNRILELSNSIHLTPGTGYHMPACTLHAPGSLVTYELQSANDTTCIPESRVDDMPMPVDLLDRDIPVSIDKDGADRVFQYILEMVGCSNSGNKDSFRTEYFRPPLTIFQNDSGNQEWIIYNCGRYSERPNDDLFSAKRTIVYPGATLKLKEKAAFGVICLGGHGTVRVPGKKPVPIESTSMFEFLDELGGDEYFIAKTAAMDLEITCQSFEPLRLYQHFASNSNVESTLLDIGMNSLKSEDVNDPGRD